MSAEFRRFRLKLERNGYKCNRINGSHYIFKNDEGKLISINKKPNRMVMQRLLRENHIE